MSRLKLQADRLLRHVDLLSYCCQRLERQFDVGRVKVTDVELVYASSFLSVCTRWEAFLEQSLFEVVCGAEPSSLRKYRTVNFGSREALRRVLLYPGKKYIGISSLQDAVGVAELFVKDGRPFSGVSEANLTFLQQAMWIRNAIAHQSDHAMRLFTTKVPGVGSLPRNRRSPGSFLRTVFRRSPIQRRYEIYFTAFKQSAVEIWKGWC